MDYKIIGETVPVVEMTLKKGESIYTQTGGLAYESDGVEMKTNARGGILKGIGRMLSGESMFMANYTAERDDVLVAFASTVPGSVINVNLNERPNGIVLQKGAFLCAEQTVETSMLFNKKLGAGLFGGEGFILQKATGKGNLFLEVDGDAIEKELKPGEILKVDTGNVVGFEPSVSYDIETVKGLGNIFLGGEGLFLTRLVGPGRVIIQTQNFNDFAGRILTRIKK